MKILRDTDYRGRPRTLLMNSFDEEQRLMELPIEDIISKFDFKDGKAEFFMYATSDFFYSSDMFGVVQSRRDEIRAKGHKVKECESGGWGLLTRTWTVYDLESSKRSGNSTVVIIIVGLILLTIYLYIALN